MKIQPILAALLMAALTANAALGQTPTQEPYYPRPAAVGPATPTGPRPTQVGEIVPATGGLSDWITYRRDCCEGPFDRVTPLFSEIYLRAGPSIPFGGQTLSRQLDTGWSIAGGWRALFFNEPLTRAWVFDAHIMNTNEGAGRFNTQFPVTFFHNGVRSDLVVFEGVAGRKTFSIQNSNRTLVGAGLGREWYLWRSADTEGMHWRVGADAGGRWGSHRINFSEFGHISDVIGSAYGAVHTDLEFPWRRWHFQTGVRVEYAYTWSDILQVTSDVQELSVFLSFGVRY